MRNNQSYERGRVAFTSAYSRATEVTEGLCLRLLPLDFVHNNCSGGSFASPSVQELGVEEEETTERRETVLSVNTVSLLFQLNFCNKQR